MLHYVLTRAAYGPSWSRSENARRLELFAGITARSLAAQTSREFCWVVLLHIDDPLLGDRKSVVDAFMMDTNQHARCIFTDDSQLDRAGAAANAYKIGWEAALTDSFIGNGRLTTRLDDDDALAKDYVARVQSAGRQMGGQSGMIELPVGWRSCDGRVSKVTRERNAMVTHYCPPCGGGHVYSQNHRRHQLPIWTVDRRPGWLWVRHRDTLSGHKYPAQLDPDVLLDDFPTIDLSLL